MVYVLKSHTANMIFNLICLAAMQCMEGSTSPRKKVTPRDGSPSINF